LVERSAGTVRQPVGRTVGHQDWRDAMPRIKAPSLFIGSKSGLVPHSCVAWESTQAPGAQLSIFGESELGSHSMFVENPGMFNSVLAELMG